MIYFTHLASDEIEMLLLRKLNSQMDDNNWNRHLLNSYCWAVGSITGSMGEDQERHFLICAIKDLLTLCLLLVNIQHF